MVLDLADEPAPRRPAPWSRFDWPVGPGEPLAEPWSGGDRPFADVAWSRRSWIGGSVEPAAAGNLLHHLTRDRHAPRMLRDPLFSHQRVSPSAGGLHPYVFVCIGDRDGRALMYAADTHSFHPFNVNHAELSDLNARQVGEALGRMPGTGPVPGVTVRIIMDRTRVEAAYRNPDTLILRDAGALLAVALMVSEWLGLSACALGFIGTDFAARLGLPDDRFVATGGFQLSAGDT